MSSHLPIGTAAAVIAASFPTVRVEGLRHLGSGCDFDAFLTADGWVFRFPRRADCAATLETELRLHALLAAALPPGVAVPRVELVAQPSAAFPYCVAGYRYLDGIAADAVDPVLLPATARTIGEALGAIHAVPEALARGAGIRELDVHDPGHRQWLEHGVSAAPGVRGMDAVVDQALDWLAEQAPLPPAPFPGPLRLIHQDLGPDHLLVDPATGNLVGILDWSDAVLGDPARDFVELVAWRGWPFVEQVLRGYSGYVDREFRARLQFTARLLSVLWLAIAHEEGTDVARPAQGVRNVFAPLPVASLGLSG